MRSRHFVAGGLVALAAATPASAAGRPDLTVRSVAGPTTAHVGDDLRFRVGVRSARAASKATRLRVVLSGDRRASSGDVKVATVKVPRIAANRTRRVTVTVSVSHVGPLHVIACADALRRVRERRESNNCRASARLTVRAATVIPPPFGTAPALPGPSVTPTPTPVSDPNADSDGDGTPDAGDCGATDSAIHPGAADPPDLALIDANCDGVDGDAANSIFVSTDGDDAGPGTRDAPVRTIQRAAALAQDNARSAVLAMAGDYAEQLIVRNGISVYGGYDANWGRSLTAVTRVSPSAPEVGDAVAAVAEAITVSTVLQLLTFEAPDAREAGADSIGLRGLDTRRLMLERVAVGAGIGAEGYAGAAGMVNFFWIPAAGDGRPGSCGAGTGPAGGAGATWWSGGAFGGGAGGDGGDPGHAGSPGGPGSDGTDGGSGGAAGNPGLPGVPGASGADGLWGQKGGGGGGGVATNTGWFSARGLRGAPGQPGQGGSGGGGGGGQSGTVDDGAGNGGGGGGEGGFPGDPGYGGGGGGGSFGLFVAYTVDDGTAPIMVVRQSTLRADAGGGGGPGGPGVSGSLGGDGGRGGTACTAEVGAGGDGGRGGYGGRGGNGGDGAGGPSWGAYLANGAEVQFIDTDFTHGAPGAGRGNGSSGDAGPRHPPG